MKGVKRPNQPLSTWEVPLEKGKRGRSDGPAFGAGGRGRGGARSFATCGASGLRSAQPRDSFACWSADACAARSPPGGGGAGGGPAAVVETETVGVPSSARLAQTVAHGIESHPPSGELGWAPRNSPERGIRWACGAYRVSGRAWARRPPSPALFAARPGLAVQLSVPFSFPPVGWSRARFLFLDRTFL